MEGRDEQASFLQGNFFKNSLSEKSNTFCVKHLIMGGGRGGMTVRSLNKQILKTTTTGIIRGPWLKYF